MATSTIIKKPYVSIAGAYANQGKTLSLNVAQYMGNTGFAFLVFTRLWGANSSGFSTSRGLYYCSGIQNGMYESCVRVTGTGSFVPTVTFSGATVTITWTNTAGGSYCIVPLFNF